jgi:hypothetical protein
MLDWGDLDQVGSGRPDQEGVADLDREEAVGDEVVELMLPTVAASAARLTLNGSA